MPLSKAEAALRVAESYVGIREGGANNRGREVEMFQHADTLGVPDVGYAWCQSFVNACWRLATGATIRGGSIIGGEMLGDGTASCGVFVSWARAHGYALDADERPMRGDHISFEFSGDRWADHVGQIARVLRVAPGLLYLVTVEGNTGPSGSVSDPGSGRDGVYKKRRIVRRSMCWLARVPGMVPQTREWPIPVPQWFWQWELWRLGRDGFRGRGFPNMNTRPREVPAVVPAWAWARLHKTLGGQ